MQNWICVVIADVNWDWLITSVLNGDTFTSPTFAIVKLCPTCLAMCDGEYLIRRYEMEIATTGSLFLSSYHGICKIGYACWLTFSHKNLPAG